MPKYLFVVLPVLAAALAMARDHAEHWLEVRSPGFTVITNSGEKQGRHIAAQFERMRAILDDAYPDIESDHDTPVVVLAVKDKREFRLLEPRRYGSKGSLALHGLFLRNSDKNYILMRLDAEGGNPYPVVYHEYTHLVLSQADGRIPLWLNEGLAEFYERTEIYDGDILLGEPSHQHVMLLREQKLLPLATLFTVDEKSPYYLEQKKGSVFYAESWALTHYLTMKDYEEKTTKVQLYVKLLSEKNDPVAAASGVFGDLKKLQRSLEAYIEQDSFDHFETRNLAKVDASELQVRSISEADAEAVEADFLACNDRPEEARALVARILQQDPENALAQRTAAFIKVAEEKHAEEQLRTAIAREPLSAAAHNELAVHLWQSGGRLEEAARIESAAVSLDSGNLDYRINLAKIVLAMGYVHRASEVLQGAAPRTPQESETVSQLLSEVRTVASAPLDSGGRMSSQTSQPAQAEEKVRGPDAATFPAQGDEFVARGRHQFVVGVMRGVRCETPHLELTVTSPTKTLTLSTENYYKVQFTAVFTPDGDLNPCQDLENRRAKIEYVESADSSEFPHVIAVELRK